MRQVPLDSPTLLPESVLANLRKTSVSLRTGVLLTLSLLVTGTVISTPTEGRINRHRIRSLVNWPGNHWNVSARIKLVFSPISMHHVQPGVSRHINDNYSVNAPVRRQLTRSKETVKFVNLRYQTGPDNSHNIRDYKLVSVSPGQTSVQGDIKSLSDSNKCKFRCCKSCTYCKRAATKERHKSGCCEQCFLCRSIVCCQTCTKCPNCYTESAWRGQTNQFWETWEGLASVKRGLHPPLPDPTKPDKVTDCHKLLSAY